MKQLLERITGKEMFNKVAVSVEEAKQAKHLARAALLFTRIQQAHVAVDKAVANYTAHMDRTP